MKVGSFKIQNQTKKYRIPIGLVNASPGGAPAESFMSEKAIQSIPDRML